MEEKFRLLFGVNAATFLVYLAFSTFVLLKLGRRLDRTSIFAMLAVLLSFLIRFTNWLVFALYSQDPREPQVIGPSFFLLDALATSIFHLNAYFFIFEVKLVH
jgi:hypothetical protein